MKDYKLSEIMQICENTNCEECEIFDFCNAQFKSYPSYWGISDSEDDEVN